MNKIERYEWLAIAFFAACWFGGLYLGFVR